ncbi:Chymotrypsin-like protease CTRL-1-like 3 [Homarus americanus]|uniref:Chymotrypsin-like protease CTRL-1-like 3 n=1 Tax=Homarus americanus TaxID=6706 RepID=A0A8J5JQZ9_HOMAM|nr:Chymotrypsin-like protease CTRL-1-like 3 [Homarus americanus]
MFVVGTGENATLSEEQESSDNTTTIFQGAVFHSATPSLLRKSSCKCGIRLSSKIVGGQPVTINQYPWNVALLNTITGLAFCGGAIINDFISVDKLLVRVGETSRQGQSTLQVPVQSIIVHPNYSGITSDDIALVKLARPLEYNEKILPVCLARGREDINNEKAIVTGWGRKTFEGALLDELHEVKIKVLPTRKCRRKSEYNFSEVHKKIICALGPGKDACQVVNTTYMVGVVKMVGDVEMVGVKGKWIQENAVGGQTCQRSFFKQRSGNKNRGNKNKSKGTAGIRDAGESTKEEGNEGGGEVEEEGKVEEEEEMKEEEEGGFDTSVLDSILGSSSEDPAAVPTFTDIHKVLDPDNEDDGERENNKRRRNKNKRKKNKRKQNKDAMNGGDGNIADDEEEENENNDMNQYEDMGGVEEEGEEESDNKNKQNKNSGNRRRNNNKKGNKRNGNKKRNKNQNGEDEECNEDASNSTKQKVNKDNRRKTNQNKGNEESEDEVNIANVGGEDVEDEVDWSNLSEALKGIAYIIKKESEVTQSNPDENVGL